MSKSGLNRLQRLGYQFWSLKSLNKEVLNNKEKEVFFLLNKKILITGDLKEFNQYVRFVPSVCRILDIKEKNLKEINKTEALEKEYNLIIDFIQDLSFKSKKTLKFDSLKLLLNDIKLKEDLCSELGQLS